MNTDEECEFFHGKDHCIWTYCIYLGPYVEDGREFDLGGYVSPTGDVSLAAVFGKEDSEYQSGLLEMKNPTSFMEIPIYKEAHRRYVEWQSKEN